jgi:hypothetical protein
MILFQLSQITTCRLLLLLLLLLLLALTNRLLLLMLLLLMLRFSIHELLHYLRDQHLTFGPDRVRHQSAARWNACVRVRVAMTACGCLG